MRKRNVHDGCVQDLHEGAEHNRYGNQPGINPAGSFGCAHSAAMPLRKIDVKDLTSSARAILGLTSPYTSVTSTKCTSIPASARIATTGRTSFRNTPSF